MRARDGLKTAARLLLLDEHEQPATPAWRVEHPCLALASRARRKRLRVWPSFAEPGVTGLQLTLRHAAQVLLSRSGAVSAEATVPPRPALISIRFESSRCTELATSESLAMPSARPALASARVRARCSATMLCVLARHQEHRRRAGSRRGCSRLGRPISPASTTVPLSKRGVCSPPVSRLTRPVRHGAGL